MRIFYSKLYIWRKIKGNYHYMGKRIFLLHLDSNTHPIHSLIVNSSHIDSPLWLKKSGFQKKDRVRMYFLLNPFRKSVTVLLYWSEWGLVYPRSWWFSIFESLPNRKEDTKKAINCDGQAVSICKYCAEEWYRLEHSTGK